MDYNNLNNTELLSIVLNNNPDIIKEAAAPYNNIGDLLNNFTESDILKVKGLGKTTINKLNALNILFDRLTLERRVYAEKQVDSPRKVFNLLNNYLKFKDQEVLMLLTLDTKNNVTHIIELFKGSLDSAVVHPREIFKYALKYSSKSIIIAHQHPGGDTNPSREDVNISKRIKEAGNILGIKLADSLVISNNKYTSMLEKGLI